jgi:hypothetical protein
MTRIGIQGRSSPGVLFLTIVNQEHGVCRRDELLIPDLGVVDVARNSEEAREHLPLLRIRQRLEVLEDVLAGGGPGGSMQAGE